MAARLNNIEFAKIFQRELDKAVAHNLLTGWMDRNAGQVKYSGGDEVKIPTINVDGLANYDRAGNTGYVGGKAEIKYYTYKMTQDRGRSFYLDKHDVDESGFVATMGTLMGEFQRTQVVPEIDAYRLSKCIKTAMDVPSDTNVEYSVEITKENVISKIKHAIKTIREQGYMGQLIIHATYDTKLALEEACMNKLQNVTWKTGGIDTTVPAFDGCPIIATPSQYMVSAIKLNDGKTGGQEGGGFAKGDSAKNCNFLVVASNAPVAITKQDEVRTFSPEVNQGSNSWKSDYRRYHDLFVLENKKKLIFASISDAKE